MSPPTEPQPPPVAVTPPPLPPQNPQYPMQAPPANSWSQQNTLNVPQYPPRDDTDNPLLRAVLPIHQSGWAIAAGYLGLFSVLVVFAPFALLCGILALRDIKANPNRHGRGRAWFGIVMATAVLGLLAYAWGTNVFRH